MGHYPPPLPTGGRPAPREPETIYISRGVPWWVLIVVSGVVALLFGVGGWMAGFVVGTGIFDFVLFDQVTMTIESPATVKPGEQFDVVVTVTNSDDGAHQIDSIDLYTSYLEGFQVVSSDPAWTGEPEHWDNYVSYLMPGTIQPGETVTMRFTLVAGDRPGAYADDLEVWFNGGSDFVFDLLETEVVAAEDSVNTPE